MLHYLNFDTIPTAAEEQGILPKTVISPLTGASYAAGTQIPIASLNPFAAQVLGALPAPNVAGATSNNYGALLLIRNYSDKFDAKIDGQINDKNDDICPFQPAQGTAVLSAGHPWALRRKTASSTPSTRTRRLATPGPSRRLGP